MNPAYLEHLVCPRCHGALTLSATDTSAHGRILEGTLECPGCSGSYPIRGGIPRFVADDNYAANFGFQWNMHYRTQYDSYTGAPISERRFFESTQWPRQMPAERILEAGCGSGRFTEHAASTGAFVVSFDYSNAVEANYRNNARFDNLLIVQASIYEMPFRPGYFSRVFCIGVIQHTPDPEKAFDCLNVVTAAGGSLVVDAYKKLPFWKQIWLTKYWVLPITKRMPPRMLYAFCVRWVNLWWGVTGLFVRLTGRRILSWFLLIADYRRIYPLPDHIQKEWAILDSFDMLSPHYDFPQTPESVRAWYQRAGLSHIEVGYGFNGIYGRGVRP